jgi:hypothetical protein
MRTGPVLWTTCVVLGALVYAESVGFWSHPAYRLFLMVTVLSWGGFVVWTPKSNRPTI